MKAKRNLILTFILFLFLISLTAFIIFGWFKKRLDNYIIEHTEREAIISANILKNYMLKKDFCFTKLEIDEQEKQKLYKAIEIFNLYKLKLFDKNGVVIFSTDDTEINEKNTKEYFINFVMRGKPYSKFEEKKKLTLEGKLLIHNVIETYVPIIKDNKFLGAFEVYYIVDNLNDIFKQIISKLAIILNIFWCIVLVIHLFLSNKILKQIKENENNCKLLTEKNVVINSQNQELQEKLVEIENQTKIIKNQADDLKIKQNFLDTILNNIPVGLLVKNTKLEYIFINATALEIFEIDDRALLINNTGELYFQPQVYKRLHAQDLQVLETKEKLVFSDVVYQPRKLNAKSKILKTTKIPIFNNKNEIENILVFVEDVTKFKEYEQIRLFNERISAIDKLAAGIAHEFNNLLSIIVNTAQFTKNYSDEPLNKEIIETLDTIIRSCERGAEIVRKIMSFTLPAKPVLKLIKPEIVLDAVIESCLKLNDFKNIKILKNYDTKNFCISVDEQQIKNALLQILINAAHAITIKSAGEILVNIEYNKKQNLIEIHIKDTGCGIPKQQLSEIFNPFFTTKSGFAKTNIKIKGSGLGLTIARQNIINNNGSIFVNSLENEWTEVIISFAAVDAKTILEQKIEKLIDKSQDFEILPKLEKQKILIVEDEVDIRVITKLILEENNINQISFATNAQECFNLINQQQLFDFIILDYQLPDANAKYILERLKNLNVTAKIIIATGMQNINKSELEKLGIDLFLEKPFNYDVLINFIKTNI